jgi:AcrR family transcriptional regulator
MGIAERKEREKQIRKNSILEAAEKIFFAEDGDKGTMDNVAEMVELSKGTLYLYFKNKTDLQYAIAEKGVGILSDYFRKVLNPDQTGREQLSDLGDEFVRFVEDYPKHFELILRFEVTEPQSKDGRETNLLMEPALSVLREIIILGQADGTIRNDLSENEIVIILWSQMIGLMQTILRKDRHIERYNVDLKRIIKGHYRIIMKGIAPG